MMRGGRSVGGYGVRGRQRQNHLPTATITPRREIGMYIMKGCNNICKIGIVARVRKKFQWTPYSVTCSCRKQSHSATQISNVPHNG